MFDAIGADDLEQRLTAYLLYAHEQGWTAQQVSDGIQAVIKGLPQEEWQAIVEDAKRREQERVNG